MRTIVLVAALACLLISGCVYRTRSYFQDQPKLVIEYQSETDLTIGRKNRYAVIPVMPDTPFVNTDSFQTVITAAIASNNTYRLSFVTADRVASVLATAAGKEAVSRYGAASTDPAARSDAAKQLAGLIGADVILLAEIHSIDASETPVSEVISEAQNSGPYTWPAFEIVRTRIDAHLKLQLTPFHTASSGFHTAILQSAEFTEIYDPTQLQALNRQRIRDENRLRLIENTRREREFRKAQEQQKTTVKADATKKGKQTQEQHTLVLLKAITADPPRTASRYLDQQRLLQDQLNTAFTQALVGFNNQFTGERMKGNCVKGYGEFRYLAGYTYKGGWENSAASGKGTLIYDSGNTFSGTFSNGYAQGFGISSIRSGDAHNVFEGFYQDGAKHGEGLYFFNSADQLYLAPENHVPDYSEKVTEIFINTAKGVAPHRTQPGTVYLVNCAAGQIISWKPLADAASVAQERARLFQGINMKDYLSAK